MLATILIKMFAAVSSKCGLCFFIMHVYVLFHFSRCPGGSTYWQKTLAD